MRPLMVTAAGAALFVQSARASAESPWEFQAGVGAGVHRTRADYPDAPPAGLSVGPAAQLDAGYRVHRIVAVGAHLGAQLVGAPEQQSIGRFEDRRYVGIEMGISGTVAIGRVTLSPWVGLQSLHGKRYRAAGLGGAYDLRVAGHERITAVVSVVVNNDWLGADNGPISDVGAVVGVGYRYW